MGRAHGHEFVRRSRRSSWAAASVAAGLGVASGATAMGQQASLQWDQDPGTAGVQDGGGAWDLSTSRWSNGKANVVWPNDGTVAVVGNGGGTTGVAMNVTIGTSVTAGGITVNPAAGSYNFTGTGSLQLVGTEPTITVNNAGSATTVAPTITSTSGLTKVGAGTLVLTGNNNIGGTLRVTGGTLGAVLTTTKNPWGGVTRLDVSNDTATGASGYPKVQVANAGANVWWMPVGISFNGGNAAGDYRVGFLAGTTGTNNTFAGRVTMSGAAYGTLVLNDAPGTQSAGVSVGKSLGGGIDATGMSRGGRIEFAGGGPDTVLGGPILAAGSVDVVVNRTSPGDEVVVNVVAGNNAWGRTIVQAGTLTLGVTNTLPASTELTVGRPDSATTATFNMGICSQTVAGLISAPGTSGSSYVVTNGANTGTLTINTAAGTTYAYGTTPGGPTAVIGETSTLSLTKAWPGTQRLTGANTYTGPTTVLDGTLVLGKDAWSPVLTSGNGADVRGGRLVFDYGGGGTSPAATVAGLLKASRSGATPWKLGRLRSTTINAARSLGWSDDGVSAVTVAYVYTGDLNLDGRLDADDYARLDRGRALHLGGWVNGDVDYDGTVGEADYRAIDTVYLSVGVPGEGLGEFLALREAQFGSRYVSALIAAVPEPGSLGMVGVVGVGGALARRRRGGRG